jgi:putative transposase
METINGLYKAECIRATVFHEGAYKNPRRHGIRHRRRWVHWYNNRRLHGSLGMVTAHEHESAHYAALIRELQPV